MAQCGSTLRVGIPNLQSSITNRQFHPMTTIALIIMAILLIWLTILCAYLNEERNWERSQSIKWQARWQDIADAAHKEHLRHARDIELIHQIQTTTQALLAN